MEAMQPLSELGEGLRGAGEWSTPRPKRTPRALTGALVTDMPCTPMPVCPYAPKGRWAGKGVLPPQLLGCDGTALHHRLELRPGDLRVSHARAQAAVRPRDDVLASNQLRVADEAVGDEPRVLQHVRRVADDARHQGAARGQLEVLEYAPLVLVTHVGCL